MQIMRARAVRNIFSCGTTDPGWIGSAKPLPKPQTIWGQERLVPCRGVAGWAIPGGRRSAKSRKAPDSILPIVPKEILHAVNRGCHGELGGRIECVFGFLPPRWFIHVRDAFVAFHKARERKQRRARRSCAPDLFVKKALGMTQADQRRCRRGHSHRLCSNDAWRNGHERFDCTSAARKTGLPGRRSEPDRQ